MIYRTILFASVAASLSGCSNVNQYKGDDAALVPIPCGIEMQASTGTVYKVYSSINSIDGAFSAAGGGCPRVATYRIMPGVRHLKVIPNLDSDSSQAILYATVDVTATLLPSQNYYLKTSYDGSKIGVQVVRGDSGEIVGSGQSTEVKQSSKGNAVLSVVPLLKGK